MNPWQAILFDLDDTLYPEREYVLGGLRAAAECAESWGLPRERSYCELCGLFEKGVRGDTFNRWLARYGLESDDRVAALVRAYREHTPCIQLYPEAHELLGRLRRRYRLGLVTDGALEIQRRKVAALELEDAFETIVYSDALGRDAWKPSPRPFHIVLGRLGVSVEKALYVGDNPTKDFLGARRAGMASVRIRHPDGLYRHLEPADAEAQADAEMPSLAGLEPILDRLLVQRVRSARPVRSYSA